MFEALLSNRTVSVLVEALPRILTAGLTMTIPLTLVSFFFAMIIAVVVALVQYANVPVLRQIARFYIWVIRGTPLLVIWGRWPPSRWPWWSRRNTTRWWSSRPCS